MRIKTMCRETVSRKVVSIVQAQNPLATCQMIHIQHLTGSAGFQLHLISLSLPFLPAQ
ncbi:hypothetical protein NC653_003172 [Populus alba x Populus x berolinensis]|uniref:Uncharacterized protein n=1 Tax=Populus alba x Populus x berolinensis TaxID=444605 RepID=A0AAD6WK90_9ROSI|nr:hypothetical protein NC653_003172 [Populus alba x Populus x berolinensis]